MSRLTIDVTEQQHQALKALAALEGKSLRQYALERLFRGGAAEQPALEEIRSLLAERLAEAQRGELVEDGIMDLAEETLREEILRSDARG
jgi:hypothetical protein